MVAHILIPSLNFDKSSYRNRPFFILAYRYIIGKGSLDNGYLDNLDNGFLNKYVFYEYVLLFID
jgi:hypothetical protein